MLFFIKSKCNTVIAIKKGNSLIRDQKSNKHIVNGYKKLVRAFKREAVLFLVAKILAVNHLQLLTVGSPSRGSKVNCKLQTWP